jgi:carbamoylphosphate synthase large subunit
LGARDPPELPLLPARTDIRDVLARQDQAIHRCDDKTLFNRILVENGLGDFIPRVGEDLRYPYILKKKIDAWGKNSHIILNEEQESEIPEKLSNPEYYRQALVPGRYEYATHVLFSNGRIVHSINIEYCFDAEVYIKGKNPPVYIRKVDHSPYLGIFSSILSLIGFEGLCCVNYKDIDGRPLLFEINPRFGGSLCGHFYSFMKYL